MPQTNAYGPELPAFLQSVAMPLSQKEPKLSALGSAMESYWKYADLGLSEQLVLAASKRPDVDVDALRIASRSWCSVGRIEGETSPSQTDIAALIAIPVLLYEKEVEGRQLLFDPEKLYQILCEEVIIGCLDDRCSFLPMLIHHREMPKTTDDVRRIFNTLIEVFGNNWTRRPEELRKIIKIEQRQEYKGEALYYALGLAVVDTDSPIFPDATLTEPEWPQVIADHWASEIGLETIQVISPGTCLMMSMDMGMASYSGRDLLWAIDDAQERTPSPLILTLSAAKDDGIRIVFSTQEGIALSSCIWRYFPDASYTQLFTLLKHVTMNYPVRLAQSIFADAATTN
ncbi:MAG: hypothetical protein EOM91_18360 [Sphingobacteriia bacterium]|nr:hypothetical protein [Sphingobacteriia bacterium]